VRGERLSALERARRAATSAEEHSDAAPKVVGTAGGGLQGAPSWAANAAVARHGQRGEQKTAQVLERTCRGHNGATVMHDLAIPIPGFSANIDHVVVSGRRVLLIDAKAWGPGFYWTHGGVTRRGLRPFKPGDKKTVEMAHQHIERFLANGWVTADFVTPLVVVWPTSGRVSLRFARFPGARLITGAQLARAVRQSVGNDPADADLVSALTRLVN